MKKKFRHLPSVVFIAVMLVGPSKCLKQKKNIMGSRISTGPRQTGCNYVVVNFLSWVIFIFPLF